MLSRAKILRALLVGAASLLVVVVGVACAAEEAAEPAQPQAAQAAADPAAPSAPSGQGPAPAKAAQAADTPLPAQAAAAPEAPKAADAPARVFKPSVKRTGSTTVQLNLHDTQVLTMPGRMRSNLAPWRDGGSNRQFSMGVYGTLLQFDGPTDKLVPWIATGWTVNDDATVYTVSLREDAVFQDGTPITAADVKAYWEHGAKPENIAGWGAASIALGTIKGWDELKAGDVTDAEGLRVIDDHTLEITQSLPWPAWPQYMAVWMTGLTKLDQVLSDPDWGNNPIGSGPYDLSYDPDSGLSITNRVESVGKVWWGEDSIIDRMVMPVVSDAQVSLIMYENNEIDILQINEVTFNQVLDPSHPWSTHLRRPNYPGIWWWGTKLAQAPMEDLFVRKALAQGMDMETIVQAVVGPAAHMGTGIFGPSASCYNPDSRGHFYDPDLARQYLDESTYGSGANVPVILADLSRGSFINISVAIKEYWKDNLNIELDVLRRERGMPRRENTQLRRYSEAAWVPDPTQIMTTFTAKDIGVLDPVPGAYEVMDALHDYARSLPLDHPDRCKAYQAVETEWFDKVYGIPFQWFEFLNFVIKPWVGGFETNSNIRVNLWDMYVEKH